MNPRSFVTFDVETTGLSVDTNDIIEIGLVRFEEGQVVAEMSQLIKPTQKITHYVVEMTGITNEAVMDAPPFIEVAHEILTFIGDALIVGHNISFDLGMLNTALTRVGLPVVTNRSIDTLDMASLIMPRERSYKLGHLAEMFNISEDNVHRAKDDALMTGHLYLILLEKIAAFPLDIINFIFYYAKAAGWMLSDALEYLFGDRLSHDEFPWILLFTERMKPTVAEDADGMPDWAMPWDADHVVSELFKSFGPKGAIGSHLRQYEPRSSQLDMLERVWTGLEKGKHQVIEAGTGTGKSFAYLVPAMIFALEHKTPIVISTKTKNLQEQLIDKDIPFLQKSLNVPLHALMIKGRDNYICVNKLAYMFVKLIQTPSQVDIVGVLSIMLWLLESENGDFSEIHNSLVTRFKSQSFSDSYSCLGNKCPFKTVCFINRLKKKAKSAHLVVVNHALLFTDIFYEANILPPFEHLILDEAHAVEDVATSCFARGISRKRLHDVAIKLVEQRVWEGKRSEDPLIHQAFAPIQVASRVFMEANISFFEMIDELFKRKEKDNLFFRKSQKKLSFNQLSEEEHLEIAAQLEVLENQSAEIEKMFEDQNDFMRAQLTKIQYAFIRKITLELRYIKNDLDVLRHGTVNHVRWIEGVELKKVRFYELKVVPVDVGNDLQKYIFHNKTSVLLTSATLSIKDNFNYFLSRLGYLKSDIKVESVALSSPFDLERNMLLCMPQDVPEYEDSRDYLDKMSDYISGLLLATKGRALVLFTSHKHLNEVYFKIKDQLASFKIQVYCQSKKVADRNLIKQFRDNTHSVLMGTDSFWEGIDVPGESLSYVIIVKLPFEVPTDPIVMARMEEVAAQGKSSFFEYVIPNAVTRFKQGVGRLIRSKSDRGGVIILDRRVLSQGYGKVFIQSVVAEKQYPRSLDDLKEILVNWLK